MTPIRNLSIVAALAVALSGCASAQPVSLEPSDTIALSGNAFAPAHAVVAVGATVTWEWDGNREHNVVGEDFSSDVMRTGTFTHTFDEPGTYRYSCTLHGNMDGIVEVTG